MSDRPPELVAASERPVELSGGPVSVEMTMDERATGDVEAAIAGPDRTGDAESTAEDAPAGWSRVLLRVEDMVADRQPGVVYDVHLARRDDSGPEPIRVGSIAPFGIEHANDPDTAHPGGAGMRATFDVTDAVATLLGGVGGDLSLLGVSFVVSTPVDAEGTPLPPPDPGSVPPMSVGRVGFFVA